MSFYSQQQHTLNIFYDHIYHNPNCEVRLKKPVRGFRFGHDDGTEDQNRIGYIKPLMIVILEMARIKFKDFVPRPKPKKRPGRHAKSISKEYQIKKKKNIKVKVDERSN